MAARLSGFVGSRARLRCCCSMRWPSRFRISRSHCSGKCLDAGDILVNGKPASAKVRVTGRDKV
ncbi:MAG: hypothetical protein CM1200mP2_55190 [Planctomycetaceae bacterium]|nr:MAG: hypothetical protein CM1200mP2_55190 [Planctomycetaceae bacterium]